VVVVANLGLEPEATVATSWASAGLARALDAWQGPGMVVVAGNLFDLVGRPDAAEAVSASLSAHEVLADSLRDFASGTERHVVCLPGSTDQALGESVTARRPLEELGIEVAAALDLHMRSGAGTRVVRVEAGVPEIDNQVGGDLGLSHASPGAPDSSQVGAPDVSLPVADDSSPTSAPGASRPQPPRTYGATTAKTTTKTTLVADPEAPWQAGIDRLTDPAGLQRFLTSRLLYRRFARFTWWLLVPVVVALALRLSFIVRALDHLLLGHPGPARALNRAHAATWGSSLAVAGAISAVELVVLGLVLGWLGRRAWVALGGGALGGGALGGLLDDRVRRARANSSAQAMSQAGTTVNDAARGSARALVERGYAGLVTGATLQAELTHLDPGFFACAGTAGELVEEHPARLGMLPVFLHHQQLAWVELETGAELHARLLLARIDQPPATLLERIAAKAQQTRSAHPVVVAACPQGESWPPPPDLGSVRNRSRRVRRWAAAAIFMAGALDLLYALTPPLRSRLHLVLEILPLGATQAAGALVALAGAALLALARGVRRGQYRAWAVSSILLGATLVLHLVRGGDVGGSVMAGAALALLMLNRREFRASSDLPSTRSAALWLFCGVAAITATSTIATELFLRFDHHRPRLALWRVGEAVVERLVGVQSVAIPDRLNDFLAPSLLAIGFGIAVVALLLATRPLVDRRRSAGHAAWAGARDIVRRHGNGTLDYFGLRSDKQWFFHRDSLVAYAIHGGICLVSPDPIGPGSEREQIWGAFRRFADTRGWVVAVMGASEDWLPVYRAMGMHDIYIGDEAVVDVQRFSLAGGHMKGLRQAYNRIAKYGYTASFHDPGRLDRQTAEQLTGLMSQSRRGEFERGFSMMLGRVFDPRDEGLLLCMVTGPDGAPAAMCQFVPARGIGGFSLDLMRRDRGEHPNGLLDFALVSTIQHLRELGCHGLSLNFAALRSVLEGERGDGVTQRVERWALKKMSSFLQIETLWRFNAKYEPDWLPRYVVYDTAEHLVPVVLAILRAESLAEVPVIGRMIAASDRRARLGPRSTNEDATGASFLPPHSTSENKVSASPVAPDSVKVPTPKGAYTTAPEATRPAQR
jgi:lysylphosphatidylglycerol synthetase-like protein (DUF2156 family)